MAARVQNITAGTRTAESIKKRSLRPSFLKEALRELHTKFYLHPVGENLITS